VAHHGTLRCHRRWLPTRFYISAALILIFAAYSTGAFAEKRVALVIGNSAYQNVAKLPNPVNDARAIAALLKKAGLDVVESRSDLDIASTRRALRDFTNIARGADIGVVYYAGHGIEVDGTNYLIPVDAVLQQDVDVEDETFSLDRVLRTLDQITRLRLVILDACRDNPFTRTMKRTIASRSVGRGLAKVEPTTSDTLIAFAAKAGSTALDGDIKNSPFTTALLRHLTTPGLDLRLAFGQIRDDVLKATSNRQERFVYGSLGGSAVALVPASEPKVAAPLPAAKDSIADARRDYYEFLNSGATKEAWNDFLQLHPTGPYANLARAQLSKLIDAEKKSADEAKAAEKAAIEKTAAERIAAEKKAAAEKAAAEEAAAEKTKAERIAAEKKTAAEKAAADEAAAADVKAAVAKSEKRTEKMQTVSRTPETEAPTERPHTETTRPSNSDSNGTWTITWTTRKGANCRGGDSGTYAVRVQNGVVYSKSGGSTARSGAARWTTISRAFGIPVSYVGVLRGKSGSGRFQNARCQGTFVARKS
jgi:Caspase domain